MKTLIWFALFLMLASTPALAGPHEDALAQVITQLGSKPEDRTASGADCGMPLFRKHARADGILLIFSDACPGVGNKAELSIAFAARAEDYFAAYDAKLPIGAHVVAGSLLESYQMITRGNAVGYTLTVFYPATLTTSGQYPVPAQDPRGNHRRQAPTTPNPLPKSTDPAADIIDSASWEWEPWGNASCEVGYKGRERAHPDYYAKCTIR